MLLVTGLFFSTFTTSFAQQGQTADELKELSNVHLKSMQNGVYDDFYNVFSQDMKAAITKEQFVATMQDVFNRAGKFEKVAKTDYAADDNYQYVIIQTVNDVQNLNFNFVYSKAGELQGFHYQVVTKLLDSETVVKPEDYAKEPLVKMSMAYLEQLHNGKIDALYDGMDISLQDKITKEALTDVWNKVAQQVGYFEEISSISKEEQGEYVKIAIIEKYSVKPLLIYMVYNDKQKMVGFFLQPVEQI